MNRAWAATLSNIWHSQSFPVWLTIIAAALFALILIITLSRAEKSAANGALTVITLLGIGIAAIVLLRSGSAQHSVKADLRPAVAPLAALSCLDEIAGDAVASGCEKALFASPESVAAAVSYAGAQVTRLAALGNVAAAEQGMTPELRALRRAIERDRYGFIAQVLMAREGCNLTSPCPFFSSLTNTAQIANNMNERAYDALVARYAVLWSGSQAPFPPTVTSAVSPPPAPSPLTLPTAPTGKPVSGDFPTSASIPPVSIMAPEPSAPGSQSVPKAADNAPSKSAPPASKKLSAQKPKASAPASLAPEPQSEDNPQ